MRFSPFIERMLTIVLVFLASFIVIGSIAYILYFYAEDVENFGNPSRTQTLLSEQKNCNTNDEVVTQQKDDSDDDDDDEIISMEDILKMRNGKNESLHQKILQKSSGMGYREGPPGPNLPYTDQASKPENTLVSDSNIVWKKDSGNKPNPPSHLLGATDQKTSGGILPGLDRESGMYKIDNDL